MKRWEGFVVLVSVPIGLALIPVWIVLALYALVLVDVLPYESYPTVSGAAVVGTWEDKSGGAIVFTADGHVVASDLNQSFGGSTSCDSVTGVGTWSFEDENGDPAGRTRGNVMKVTIRSLTMPQARYCGLAEFTTDTSGSLYDAHKPLTLCVDFDPDDPCSGEKLTKLGP
jgi:hypothetical protein